MKTLVILSVLALGQFSSVFAAEYSNFPTITEKTQTIEACQSFVAEQSAKYGARVLKSSCDVVRERTAGGSSNHGAPDNISIKATVIIDTL